METEKTAPAAEEKKVLIFHTGKGHGPMDTGHGIIAPGTTLKVPEHCSKKLCAATARPPRFCSSTILD